MKMKKILLIAAVFLALSTSVKAEFCKDGAILNGKKEGTTYCVSPFFMTWWSAFSWCESQEGHLASLKEFCSYDDKAYNATCHNVAQQSIIGNFPLRIDVTYAWTATPKTATTSYVVLLHYGTVSTMDKSDRGRIAVCIPK